MKTHINILLVTLSITFGCTALNAEPIQAPFATKNSKIAPVEENDEQPDEEDSSDDVDEEEPYDEASYEDDEEEDE